MGGVEEAVAEVRTGAAQVVVLVVKDGLEVEGAIEGLVAARGVEVSSLRRAPVVREGGEKVERLVVKLGEAMEIQVGEAEQRWEQAVEVEVAEKVVPVGVTVALGVAESTHQLVREEEEEVVIAVAAVKMVGAC